ncbi:LuxR C-terminal-related transcriptional regulator [Halomonas sp. EGI 63088]|uniref:LuxR C-terminal-related transcriptional regulator n=1 Tax=Halomonas flagellata TaxID=2920385 RepID=A0ABS9RV80_9GAMM|nr:LuxR C-terminal-related transcriptional regulator [Halomonas flagellata]
MAQHIKRTIGGHSVNLALEDRHDHRFSFFFTDGANASSIAHYESNIIEHDEFGAVLERQEAGTSLLSQDLWGERELAEIYPYEDFYKPLGYTYFNSGLFYRDAAYRGWVSVVRSLQDTPFSRDEHLLMKALMPHLNRAFLLNLQLVEATRVSRLALDALERVSAAVILLSTRGRVLQHNVLAERYLCPTRKLTDYHDLRLPDAAANRILYDTITRQFATRLPDAQAFIPFTDENVKKVALCFPWRSSPEQVDWLGRATGSIIFILTPGASQPSTIHLERAYQLSKAENRVLMGLLEGNTAAELADRLFVSQTTIRFHIRSLLRKFDSRNQVDMIIKALGCGAVHLG